MSDELRSALATIQDQRDTIRRLMLHQHEPIAIVGAGLRFPGGSTDLDSFTEFLREGRSGIGPVPEGRWDAEQFTPTGDGDDRGRIRTVGGGFLDRIDEFDAQFFNISPMESAYLDPQQRMLLETAWEALENAGIDPTPLRGGTGGVYVGASSVDYALEMTDLAYEDLDGHLASGTTMFPLSGRLSYFLGWRGPSLSVDTACASSLTALHLAVQGLRRGECEVALCGGVNAIHHPRVTVTFSHANMLAPDAQCKTFDDAADGYVRAEGCSVLVLKRLSDAKRDGDRILALVRGTAVGQDGASAGLTVPNGVAQAQVMRTALADAVLKPADVQYVEAHGTGTPLGDPIEMSAIHEVFADSHTAERPLTVGSVKTNLGHMEPASGMSGIVKIVLQMREKQMFPHLNFHKPSGRIPWSLYPVTVPTECRPWDAPVRRAVVNNFGFAGTIAAAVLEEAPFEPPAPPAGERGKGVLTLSARNQRSLRQQVERYRDFLAERPGLDLSDLCYTSNVARSHFGTRLALIADSREVLLEQLERAASAQRGGGRDARKVAFLFTGQGAQYAGMGAALYRQYPEFARRLDECENLFRPLLGRSVRALILGEDDTPEQIDETRYTQPALFAFEYALAGLWMSFGVQPSVMIGHSIGEVVAAALAGVFSLADAARLVAARGRLMQSVTVAGGMAAVSAPVEQVQPLLEGHPDLAIAAVNSPQQCVISGADGPLEKVCGLLAEQGLRVKRLTVSHAFHSPLMDEAAEAFRAELADVEFHEPKLALVSNLTGAVVRPGLVSDPEYWVRHIREAVAFSSGMGAVEARGRHVFVEVGPSAALTGVARACVNAADHRWLASAAAKDPQGDTLRRALAQAYTAGLSLSWSAVHRGREGRRIDLPFHVFDRKRYWLPNERNRHRGALAADTRVHHPLLGQETTTDAQRADGIREFTTKVGALTPAWLGDHRVGGQPALPAAASAEALLALQDALCGWTAQSITDLTIHQYLVLDERRDTELLLRAEAADGGATRLTARGPMGADGERPLLAEALLLAEQDGLVPAWQLPAGRPADRRGPQELYGDLTALGVEFGPAFQRYERASRFADGTLTAELLSSGGSAVDLLPVPVLECALRTVTALADEGPALVPAGIGRLRLLRKPRAERLEVRLVPAEPRPGQDAAYDLLVLEDGRPVLAAEQVGYVRSDTPGAPRRHWYHEPRWVAKPVDEPSGRERELLLVHPAPAVAAALADRPGVRIADTVPQALAALREQSATDLCWYWQPSATDRRDVAALRAECQDAYRELLELAAGLEAAGFGRDQRLWLATERGQHLPGDTPDGGFPAAASLWGFGHVLLNEYPTYRVTQLDLPGEPGDGDTLFAEVHGQQATEFQVAHRSGTRYVRRIVPSEAAAEERPVALRADRTYLVTGGLGALGLVTAHRLVDLGARHLALVGRGGTPSADLAELFADLCGRAEVTVHRADIAQEADVARIMADIEAGGHRLGGLVHTAGVLSDGAVPSQTWESFDTVFQAKVYGTWLLHRATAELPELEFFVCYSSAAALLGGVTQSNYAAANAFMDDLMHRRSASGLPALSINWGAWSEVGMSSRLSAQIVRAWEEQGIRFFSPSRGMRALTALLGSSAAQVGAGDLDWQRFVPSKPVVNAFYDEVYQPDPTRSRGLDVDRLTLQSRGERISAIEEFVRGRVADVLHLEDVEHVDPDVEFGQLGLDSLVAMELRSALEAAFRMPLPASMVFDHPSAERLTEFLDSQLVPATAPANGTPR